MKVDINLQKVDIDQCSSDGWFPGTHKCHLNNSEVRTWKQNSLKSEAHKRFTVIKLYVFICVGELTRRILIRKKKSSDFSVAKWAETGENKIRAE
jgi:hypothetical protein